MSGDHVRFSVVIPLYNKREFIRRAVDSVLAQTLPCFELIVVDDGSTDGSVQQLDGMPDGRVRVVPRPNGGHGAARNTGIANAMGEWVAFLDADDMWLPTHLAELARVIAAFPHVAMVAAASRQVETGSTAPLPVSDPNARLRELDYFHEASHNIGVNNSSSTAVRRTACLAVGEFLPRGSGLDLEYWARVALRFPVAVSDAVTCIYYRNTNGMMEQIARETKSVRRVDSLSELSFSMAALCRANAEDPSVFRRPSVVLYVNSRVYNAVRIALFRGDVDAARARTRMFIRPLGPRETALRMALGLPGPLVEAGLRSYTAIRAVRRAAASRAVEKQ